MPKSTFVFYTLNNIKEVRISLLKQMNKELKPFIQPNEIFDMNALYQHFIIKNNYPYGFKRFQILIRVYINHQDYDVIYKTKYTFKTIEKLT